MCDGASPKIKLSNEKMSEPNDVELGYALLASQLKCILIGQLLNRQRVLETYLRKYFTINVDAGAIKWSINYKIWLERQ